MERLRQDLRYAFRLLLKKPLLTVIVVVNIALGAGANVAIFSALYAVVLQPLPFRQPDRLVALSESNPEIAPEPVKVSYPNFDDWRKEDDIFEQMAAYRDLTLTLLGEQQLVRINAQAVSPDFFPLLGVEATKGRTFLRDEDKGEKAVILSYKFWQQHYGASQDVLGKSLALENASYTVIGIMPAGFEFLQDAEVWIPLNIAAPQRGARNLQVVGRLKPSTTVEQARAAMGVVARQLAQQYPETNSGWEVSLVLLQDKLIGSFRQRLLVLFAAAAFVLLIACANTANLLLAQAAARQREFAIRLAIGAKRSHLIRQSLTMSAVIGALGSGLGLLLAFWGMQSLLAMGAWNVPRMDKIKLNGGVLAFSLAVAFLSSLSVGLIPAIQSTKPDLNRILKHQVLGSNRLRLQHWQGLLVASEIALAEVLLIGAGLLSYSFLSLAREPLGFQTDKIVSLQVPLPAYKYRQDEQRIAFFNQLLERIGTLPQVRSTALINSLPLSGIDYKNSFSIKGHPTTEPMWASVRTISPDYFRTMGIPLLSGRSFTIRDDAGAPDVAVINDALAQTFWPNDDAIGNQLYFEDRSYIIIGVVGNAKITKLDSSVMPAIYFSLSQDPQYSMVVVAQTQSDPGNLIGLLRAQVTSIDKDQPVEKIQTMEEVLSRAVSQPRFSALLLGLFAALALVLAVSGVYGVLSYSITQRTHEIGIRMALGATNKDVLKLVVGQGMVIVALGAAGGLIASLALTRLMASMLFGVTATDLTTILIATLFLGGVALIACYIPGRRAAKLDPAVTLRCE